MTDATFGPAAPVPVPLVPPDEPCPDCEAPADRWCFPWCDRYRDYDLGFEDAQAGDHPDGDC
jgi:hypothetical protein